MKRRIRGVVLAGGTGTRLRPLTLVTNKHLLPVYDRPMIYYPIDFLVRSGIKDICVVVGGNSVGDVLRLLKDGKDLGANQLYYVYQEGAGGISDAIRLTRDFVGDNSSCVVLGDNIMEYNISNELSSILDSHDWKCHVFLKNVHNPSEYGCPEFASKVDRIHRVVEKPTNPPSVYAVTGVYLFDNTVYDKISRCIPSSRGELEVTDVINLYAKDQNLTHSMLPGYWGDAGSITGLYAVSALVSKYGANKDV